MYFDINENNINVEPSSPTNILKPTKKQSPSPKRNALKNLAQKNSLPEESTLPNAIKVLKKSKLSRTRREIKILGDYLSKNFEFFKRVKRQTNSVQYEKTLICLKYEEYFPNTPIIYYGDEGDKFYILLDGKISMYKPTCYQQEMTLRKFVIYLKECDIKDPTGNMRGRVIEKNSFLNFSFLKLLKEPIELIDNIIKYNLYLEKFEKFMEASEGFSFGESSIIHKTKRNATIITNTLCRLIMIEKNDFNKIIKDLEQKRLEEELREFKNKFNIFKYWSSYATTKLLQAMTNIKLFRDDYVYKQNEESEFIYFNIKGNYEIYSLIGYAWKKQFIEYIANCSSNLFIKIDPFRAIDFDTKNVKIYDEAKKLSPISPMKSKDFIAGKYKMGDLEMGNFASIINKNEEHLADPYNLFKVNMRNFNGNDIIGFEEAVEFKKRYTFVKVKSDFAILKKIKIEDFFNILNLEFQNEKNIKLLVNYLCEKKQMIIQQIALNIKHHTKNKSIIDFISEYQKLFCKNTHKKPPRNIITKLKYIEPNKENMKNSIEEMINRKLANKKNLNVFNKSFGLTKSGFEVKEKDLSYDNKKTFSNLRTFSPNLSKNYLSSSNSKVLLLKDPINNPSFFNNNILKATDNDTKNITSSKDLSINKDEINHKAKNSFVLDEEKNNILTKSSSFTKLKKNLKFSVNSVNSNKCNKCVSTDNDFSLLCNTDKNFIDYDSEEKIRRNNLLNALKYKRDLYLKKNFFKSEIDKLLIDKKSMLKKDSDYNRFKGNEICSLITIEPLYKQKNMLYVTSAFSVGKNKKKKKKLIKLGKRSIFS